MRNQQQASIVYSDFLLGVIIFALLGLTPAQFLKSVGTTERRVSAPYWYKANHTWAVKVNGKEVCQACQVLF